MDENQANIESPEFGDNVKKIPLGILPAYLGTIWERTGTPITALGAYTIATLILCTFMTYELCTLVIVYSYMATYLFVIVAFIVTKIYEPDAPRGYEVPGGTAGAVVCSVLTIGTMGFAAIYIGISYYYWAALLWLVCNVLFAIYYFTLKRLVDRQTEYENVEDQ